MTLKPTYLHDCDGCVFLGTTIGGGRATDLYYHLNQGRVTLIARYSNEGSEYYSSDRNYIKADCCHAELFVAKHLFEQTGTYLTMKEFPE